MQLDIKKAFMSPFSEEKWYLKLIFPAVIAAFNLAANILGKEHKLEVMLIGLIILIPSLILTGFFSQFAHNEIKDELPLLPTLKSKVQDYLQYGLKLLGAILIYSLIFFLISFLFSLAVGLVIGIVSFLLGLNKAIIPIGIIIFLLPLVILGIAFMALVQGAFAENFSFREAIDFKRIYSYIFIIKKELVIYMLLALGLSVLLSIIGVIFTIFKITLVLLPFLVAMEQLISINLKAQVYKIAKSRLIIPE